MFYIWIELTMKVTDMKKLRIHYLQHVLHEGLGSIEEWASLSGHTLTATKFYENVRLPEISDIDWLIIMGGPMNVYDEQQFPWLADEKKFIRQAIDEGKTVLGICLGSQLISAALGARVYKNDEREIGWFDVELTCFAKSNNLVFDMEDKIKVFHWHGDTFDLPENAIHLFYSRACKNQAYIYKEKVLALQFHLEQTLNSLEQMIEYGRKELTTGKFVQSEKKLLMDKKHLESNRTILFVLLTRLAEQESS
jgi:GMP synthase (glutamine-hydrolysing)